MNPAPYNSLENAQYACTRQAFGKELLRLAQQDSRILALSADLTISVQLTDFMEQLPEQFINFGIAEQNMVSAASGLAIGGMIPFAASFAAFIALRACEQARVDCAYSNTNVKLVGTSSGISAGPAGPTHQCIEDIAIFRSMPNMVVLTPADAAETKAAVKLMSDEFGPMYLRLGRDKWPVLHTSEEVSFKIGGSECFRDGEDITIFAIGNMVSEAIKASEILAKENISARVISFFTIKPIDRETILQAVCETKAIITVEDHNLLAGMGSAVAEVAAEAGVPFSFKAIGVPDVYPPIGDAKDLYKRYSMTADGIVQTAKTLIERKKFSMA